MRNIRAKGALCLLTVLLSCLRPTHNLATAGGAAQRKPDTDQDSTSEEQEQCPTAPEDKDNVQDEDGCPEPNNDNDAFLDAVDPCPNDDEDYLGVKDGCPEPDDDKDGILNATDICPKEAEDRDFISDEDGCPEEDADHDLIVDTLDKCPTQKEALDGTEDEDGCPEKGPSVFLTDLAILQLVINFERNQAKLNEESKQSLDQLARELSAISIQLLILGLAAEGETNKERLGKMRAAAVRDYLIARGIDPKTMEARSLSTSDPEVKPSVEFMRVEPARLNGGEPQPE